MAVPIIGLFVLAVLAALYASKMFILPIALALLISFVFRPFVRALASVHIPQPLSALIVVTSIFGAITFGIYSLADPAQQWIEEAPGSLRQLRYRVDEWRQPVDDAREATKQMDMMQNMNGESANQEVVVKEKGLDSYIFTYTTQTAVALFTTLVLLFFILGWGERLYRNLVNAQSRFANQRQIVQIVQDIEESVSSYLRAITVINIILGVIVGMTLYYFDVPNAALWAVITACLNYVPYLGPAVTACIIAFVCLLTFDSLGKIALIPGVFLAITTLEGYFITPMAIGRRLTLNPLIIFLSLILWFALWGFVGAILTVPILICVKVTLERIESTKPFAAILD